MIAIKTIRYGLSGCRCPGKQTYLRPCGSVTYVWHIIHLGFIFDTLP